MTRRSRDGGAARDGGRAARSRFCTAAADAARRRFGPRRADGGACRPTVAHWHSAHLLPRPCSRPAHRPCAPCLRLTTGLHPFFRSSSQGHTRWQSQLRVHPRPRAPSAPDPSTWPHGAGISTLASTSPRSSSCSPMTGLIMLYVSAFVGLNGERMTVTQGSTPMPVSALAEAAAAAVPDGRVAQYISPLSPDHVAVFRVEAGEAATAVQVNPYTAEIVGQSDWDGGWYPFATEIHGTLLLGDTGDRLDRDRGRVRRGPDRDRACISGGRAMGRALARSLVPDLQRAGTRLVEVAAPDGRLLGGGGAAGLPDLGSELGRDLGRQDRAGLEHLSRPRNGTTCRCRTRPMPT